MRAVFRIYAKSDTRGALEPYKTGRLYTSPKAVKAVLRQIDQWAAWENEAEENDRGRGVFSKDRSWIGRRARNIQATVRVEQYVWPSRPWNEIDGQAVIAGSHEWLTASEFRERWKG